MRARYHSRRDSVNFSGRLGRRGAPAVTSGSATIGRQSRATGHTRDGLQVLVHSAEIIVAQVLVLRPRHNLEQIKGWPRRYRRQTLQVRAGAHGVDELIPCKPSRSARNVRRQVAAEDSAYESVSSKEIDGILILVSPRNGLPPVR